MYCLYFISAENQLVTVVTESQALDAKYVID